MKWLLQSGPARTIIDMPTHWIEGRPTAVVIDGVEYETRWHAYSGTLYVTDKASGREAIYQLRDLVIEPAEDRAARTMRLQYRGATGAIETLTTSMEQLVPGLENRGRANQEQSATLRSPMAGTLLRLDVQEGDRVEKGQTLCIIEAMKMENQIKAPVAGVIQQMKLTAGQSVTPRQKLFVIKDQ